MTVSGKGVIMNKRKAGNTDMDLSLLGFGGFHLLEVSQKDCGILLDTYLDSGGNYIETAAGYGNGGSEIRIGNAVSGKRNSYFLASKCHEREYSKASESINNSLKNLKTDYLDILFIHALQTAEEADIVLSDDGAVKAALEAKESGKIRYIGVSGHGRPDGLLSVCRRFDFDVCMTMFNYYDRFNYPGIEQTLLPLLIKKNTAVFGMKALADGYLYNSVSQGIRYSLSLPVSTLVMGMNRLDHLEMNIKAVNEFRPFELKEYNALFSTARELGSYVCRLCGKCRTEDFDPQEYFLLEGLFDRQMESFSPEENPADFALRERLKHWFGQAEKASEEYRELVPISVDHDYSDLNALCPYSIDIDRKLKIIHSKLSGAEYIY